MMTDKVSVEQRRLLLAPRIVRQAILEHEHFGEKIQEAEAAGIDKSQYTTLWMETVNRKNQFKRQTGLVYEPPPEISRTQRTFLAKMFRELSGFTWANTFGWVGQSATLTRPEIDAFVGPTITYDGLLIDHVDAEAEEAAAKMNSFSTPTNFAGTASSAKATAAAAEAAAAAIAVAGQSGIIGIDLSAFGCDGRLQDGIGLFEHCQFLRMNWNLIVGPLPRKLSFLNQLHTLELSSNLLNGELDLESFSRLKSLTTLDLSFNEFSGSIPDMFGSVSQLQMLNLAGNQFTGELPPSLSLLGNNLVELKLYNNQLTGVLPESLSCLQQLKHVNLSQNRFTEGINVFNTCSELQTLQLHQNNFHGRLDATIAGMRSLELLYLQHNQLSGLIPHEVGNLKRLRRLNLSHNNFRGTLPDSVGQLIELQTLLLTGNTIIGPLPRSISQLQKLRDFHIFRAYPSESAMPPTAFDRNAFERIHVFAPKFGIDTMHWDYMQLYGRERDPTDDETVTLFSGTL